MPHLQVYSNFLIFYDNRICLFTPNESNEPVKIISVKELLTVNQKQQTDCSVDALQVSPCGQYMALTVRKELVLLSFPSLSVLSNKIIEKTAFCVRFFNNSNGLLVADRSGLVTFFSYDAKLEKKDLNLGHNSMLTDAVISKRDDFIITSDRDEKIRVSCYPNVYNIVNFCLGHEKFVSNMCWIPSDERILASASGDGTIRIWDFINGQLLCTYKIDSADKGDAIVKIVSHSTNCESCIAVQTFKTRDIAILSVSGSVQQGVQIALKHKIVADSIILDLIFWDDTLIYLVADDKNPFQSWPQHKSLQNLPTNILQHINESNLDTYKVLYRRYFDNVQEYLEKKKARLVISQDSN